MFSLLNPLHVLFMNDETETRVVCHLDAVAEHDVLVLAVVGVLAPDVLLALQHPVQLGTPPPPPPQHRAAPPLALRLELGAEREPGAEDGAEHAAWAAHQLF